MKKLIFLLAAVSVGFTGCWKDDGSSKKLEPVRKGIQIYQITTSQNNIASQPATIGVMFGMLHAEAAKQNVDNLNEVKVNNINLKNKLFGTSCTITAEADGVYNLTFSDNGYLEGTTQRVGTLYVHTQSKLLKDTDANSQWSVALSQKFQLKSYSGMDNQVTVAEIKGGQTALYNNGDGTYKVDLNSIVAAYAESSTNSDWSGSFSLKPASEGFAYSDCVGKAFEVRSGYVSGPSMYSTTGNSTSISMSYRITNGKYLGYYITGGTEECEFTANYDMTYYLPSDVTYEWGLNPNGVNRWVKVSYNGHEVTENL